MAPGQLQDDQVLLRNIYGQKVVVERNPLVDFFPELSPIGVWQEI